MNINATIFVQIVHFLCAYYILRSFLLRPVADSILSERAYRKKLEDTIDHEELVRIHKQEQQKKQWRIFQDLWQTKIPSLEVYVKKVRPELDIKKVALPVNKIEQESDKIAALIKERVDYAQ